MVSELKATRDKKKSMLREMGWDILSIISLKTGRMDRIDFRILKEASKKLRELKIKAQGSFKDPYKIISSQPDMTIPDQKEEEHKGN
jgi:hypothetical protein